MNSLENRYQEIKRKLFMKYYGARLNPEQCDAVFTSNGPLLVLAGAGSGKTTVLVNRIAYLIMYGNGCYSDEVIGEISEERVAALEGALSLPVEELPEILCDFIESPAAPWRILAITFTNKAAREIKERLDKTFEDKSVTEAVWTGTFHSVCLRFLRKFGDRLGYQPGFSIYDTDDKKRMVALCMKELGIDEKRLGLKAVCNEISMAKDRLEPPEAFNIAGDPRSRDIGRIYAAYQKKLLEYNAVDFDDIIMKTVELLTEHADVREYYQGKFDYILIDEYQDTNYAQFELTRILADKHKNIMVVGDDDQSIYRFRGATVENILNFDKTYRDAHVVKLERNYRSTENILHCANEVIKNNNRRHEKSLRSVRGAGEYVTVHEAEDQHAEGRYILERINAAVKTEGRKYSDFAVLYRVNELARSLETTFTKSGIPYKVLGNTRFYDRKEIKDMFAYLSVICSPGDNLRLKRIINEPKRKIGAVTVEAIEDIAGLLGTTMYDVMARAGEFDALKKSADKLSEFTALIEKIKSEHTLPSELIEAVFVETGYRDMLVAEGFEGEGKINNVSEFTSAAVEYEKRCAESGEVPTLVGFVEEISLISDVDKYDESADAVVLMTVHAAKGLEFPVVFIAGCEDGIFPASQSLTEPLEMAEERRLMYVAITRAKDKLYITHASQRTMYGRTGFNPLSGFIRKEIPRELVRVDAPKKIPPRMPYGYDGAQRRQAPQPSREMRRPPDISQGAPRRAGAESFGVQKLSVGTRVNHFSFGNGTVKSARDLGGDVLYEVEFDTGVTKKLMATFAKLKKI